MSPAAGESPLQEPGGGSPGAALSGVDDLSDKRGFQTGIRLVEGVQEVQKRFLGSRNRQARITALGGLPAPLGPGVESGPGNAGHCRCLLGPKAREDPVDHPLSKGVVTDAAGPTGEADDLAATCGFDGRQGAHATSPSAVMARPGWTSAVTGRGGGGRISAIPAEKSSL